MASYEATKAQRVFYFKLTGEWPPRGASKSKVSKMIDDAKNGKLPAPKARKVEVHGYQPYVTMLNGYDVLKFVVSIDYRHQGPSHATYEEALAFAKGLLREGDELIEAPTTVSRPYID